MTRAYRPYMPRPQMVDALRMRDKEIERLRDALKKISAAANRGVLNMDQIRMIGDWARTALKRDSRLD